MESPLGDRGKKVICAKTKIKCYLNHNFIRPLTLSSNAVDA